MTAVALPVLSGVLLALSFPPFPSTPLPFVALVPLGVFLAELPGGRAGLLRACRGGALAGAVLFGLLLHWIPLALPSPWPGVPAWLAAVALLSLAPALAAAATHLAMARQRLPLWAALPVAWTGAEWLRAHLPAGFAFPWLGTAASLAGLPDALALAEWLGERGVTLWVALVGALVAEGVVRRRRGGETAGSRPSRSLPPVLAAGVVLLVPMLAGRLRADSLETGPRVRVALVRTELGRAGRAEPDKGVLEMAGALERLLPSLQPGSADLVLLPETAFPLPLEGMGARRWREALRRHAARLGAPLVVGALALAEDGRGVHNSVFLIDGTGVRARYDKRLLVPGVERTPLLPSRFLAALGETSSYRAGRRRPLPAVDGLPLGPLVCFESAFGGLAREHVRAGARLLLNPTNDDWFGGWGGAARAQHEAHLVVRAVEGRIGVARAANGGASLVVDPSGRVTIARDEGEGVEVLDVATALGATAFVRFGDVVGRLSALLALLGALTPSRAPARRSSPPVERPLRRTYIFQAVEPAGSLARDRPAIPIDGTPIDDGEDQ